jgi:predicted kinase
LRLEHVYFRTPGAPTIIDCIEFNAEFRYADVSADVSFLSMDLARLGRVDLAERLLAVYAREANDFDLFQLIDFYEGYRAFVRGKVAGMLEADGDASLEARQAAQKQARRHYLLALASGRARLMPPMLIAVGGIIAAGKSTVSEFVARRASAPVVSSDRTRKYLLGLEPEVSAPERAWAGAYAPEFTERVYTEVLRRGACVLQSGRPVVLDASFWTQEFRSRARLLAHSYQVPFRFIECKADLNECRRRLQARAQGSSVSDARVNLLQEFSARWEAVAGLSSDEHLVLDTTQSFQDSQELLRWLPVWPPGLTQ